MRYVLVEIEEYLAESRTLAMLGHELQHALEILEDPAIVDGATFALAYERIAVAHRHLGNGGITYDTTAARTAGLQVWRELTRPSLSLETR